MVDGTDVFDELDELELLVLVAGVVEPGWGLSVSNSRKGREVLCL